MLNDCKYGHDIHDGVMRLTLLKSATYPNVDADRCMHYLTYSIVPHEGDYREAGVVQMAYDLNKPMTAVTVGAQDGTLADSYSLVSVSAPNVILETVKQAESGEGTVLRLYEAHNARTKVTVKLPEGVKSAYITNLLEQIEEELTIEDGKITFVVKPYEIMTILLK